MCSRFLELRCITQQILSYPLAVGAWDGARKRTTLSFPLSFILIRLRLKTITQLLKIVKACL